MIKFGTDGWRAVIGEDFTFHNVRVVSQAVADYLKKEIKKPKKVIIGYDTRFLSKEFALASGLTLAGNGIKVDISKESIPTPVVSFNARYSGYDLGIMITASHNPYKFNGVKIKTKDGGAADKSLTDRIEKFLYRSKPKTISLREAAKKGILKVKDFTLNYKEFLKSFFDIKRISQLRFKILIDLMYGAGNSFTQEVISSSSLAIDYLHKEFNPSFGGIHPEPVENNLKELIKRVKKEDYNLGVALDGDGDRIALVDSKGNFINAQLILPLLAIHMIKNRREVGGIGKTVVGSNLIDEVALSLGVNCFETPVGFKFISNLFKENLICIGGEEAGGIGFKGYIPERDGTASFLMVLEMIAYEGKSLDSLIKELRKRYGRWYYTRVSVSLGKLAKSMEKLKIPSKLLGKRVERVNRLDGIKLITKDSWLMFRKSGTEPIVRIYAEAKTKKERDELIKLGTRLIHAL
ncbi:MAG: phosphoglucomutase/phosphomannomutase family protein [Candidatus Omnitrophota bacterium]|nr:MAG: phosphoglucomutase/phosphomannomutase family protein [Candidatus Omnitrophota bacterium]